MLRGGSPSPVNIGGGFWTKQRVRGDTESQFWYPLFLLQVYFSVACINALAELILSTLSMSSNSSETSFQGRF